MAKFVTFDDGCGKYNFRAIFPSTAKKAEIIEALKRKLNRWRSDKGLDKEDMPSNELIREWVIITSMKEGKFYEPDPYFQWDN